MQSHVQGIPKTYFLQLFCGMSSQGRTVPYAILSNLCIGQVYMDIHYRLHVAEIMSYKTCIQSRDHGGLQKQDYGGMVLRIQTAYRDQRPRRDNVVDANAMKRGR